jgi:hypothetical protein
MGLDNITAAEITVRNDAPPGLRDFLVTVAYDAGLSPRPLRPIVCRILRVAPDPGNWSEWPNIAYEVSELVGSCPWYNVYDIIEAIYDKLSKSQQLALYDESMSTADFFATEINAFFMQNGIGWQLTDGQIQIRGPEVFEEVTRKAIELLDSSTRATARNEIHEALGDLSRRPDPDKTGAVQHALAALECIARDVSGDSKSTLGDILRKHPDLLPRPLASAIEKVWGYASEYGRHLREGREPTMEEAEFLVGLAGAVAIYLARKAGTE